MTIKKVNCCSNLVTAVVLLSVFTCIYIYCVGVVGAGSYLHPFIIANAMTVLLEKEKLCFLIF